MVNSAVLVNSELAARLIDEMIDLRDIHRLSHAPCFPQSTFALATSEEGVACVRRSVMLCPHPRLETANLHVISSCSEGLTFWRLPRESIILSDHLRRLR